MSIEINAIEPRDGKRQIAYFTIDGQEFSCGNVPAELNTNAKILKYLNARANEFKLLIIRKQYPESDHARFRDDGKTELEAMEKWIADGHKNKVQVGLTAAGNPKYDYEVIKKKELEYRHPKWVSLTAKIEEAKITPEMKNLLKEIIRD